VKAAPALRDLGRPGGYPAWGVEWKHHRVLFTGRGGGAGEDGAGDGGERQPAAQRAAVLAAVLASEGPSGDASPAPPVAAARQVHSARVLVADGPGLRGEADALLTRVPGLALSVITADCVPVLVSAGAWSAAIHAGWRGVAAGVVGAALDRLRSEGAGDPASWSAWIGPAIASCCYEVGDDVAAAVAAAAHPDVVIHDFPGCAGDGSKPRLDLAAAVRHQLAAAGVGHVAWQVSCTACDAARLHSYRRDGRGAGRNHAFIWRPS
jgi:hypothetical protein